METIERVGLSGLHERLPGELSGGEQQRAAIARAIVGKPTIILADEPTGNLDESMSHDIFELLSSICRHEGATILVATHDKAEVALWPFRQVRLWESRIEADRPALWQPWEHYPSGLEREPEEATSLSEDEESPVPESEEFILSDYNIPQLSEDESTDEGPPPILESGDASATASLDDPEVGGTEEASSMQKEDSIPPTRSELQDEGANPAPDGGVA